jgi:hypothetical protein
VSGRNFKYRELEITIPGMTMNQKYKLESVITQKSPAIKIIIIFAIKKIAKAVFGDAINIFSPHERHVMKFVGPISNLSNRWIVALPHEGQLVIGIL